MKLKETYKEHCFIIVLSNPFVIGILWKTKVNVINLV